jgi:chromatin licensing and DNA replication factor 1
MKTVYPTAFNFRQEKNIPGLYDKRSKYHLTVECRVEEERSSSAEETKEKGATKNTKGALNATTLIKRRKKFNQNLTEIIKKLHKAFLASLKPPLHIPDEKILRWHPAFALDSVPEVEAAPLPSPPIKETYTTAKDVLNVAQDRLAERVQAALASASDGVGSSEACDSREGVGSSEAGDSREGVVVKREEESGVTNPELKGVSTTLLEKVNYT